MTVLLEHGDASQRSKRVLCIIVKLYFLRYWDHRMYVDLVCKLSSVHALGDIIGMAYLNTIY